MVHKRFGGGADSQPGVMFSIFQEYSKTFNGRQPQVRINIIKAFGIDLDDP